MQPTKKMRNFVLPRRLQGVAPTLIRQIFERALPDSINFGLGEPDLPTPQFIREEAARVTLEEQNGYTNHAGLLGLREKIAASYPHLNLKPNQVCVTVGSQEAMTAAFLGIVDEGDEVLIPNPSFPAYENCVKISGGEPVYYRLPAEKDFAFRHRRIQIENHRRKQKRRSLFRRRIRRGKFSPKTICSKSPKF